MAQYKCQLRYKVPRSFRALRIIIELMINNVNLNVSVVKSAFQNLPQRLVSLIVVIYPVLDNLFRSFSIIDGYRLTAVSGQLN